MYPRHWIHCASLNAKGKPCGNNGNCPAHREANRERHRADDESRIAKILKPQQMSLPLSREQRDALIEAGRQQAIAESNGFGSALCGCQG